MLRQVLRLMMVSGALVWLSSVQPGSHLYASFDCECRWQVDGWVFVLVNPHCGTATATWFSTQSDNAGCANWCSFVAVNARPATVCNGGCDQDPSTQPNTYSYQGCWVNHDTGGSGCFGPTDVPGGCGH